MSSSKKDSSSRTQLASEVARTDTNDEKSEPPENEIDATNAVVTEEDDENDIAVAAEAAAEAVEAADAAAQGDDTMTAAASATDMSPINNYDFSSSLTSAATVASSPAPPCKVCGQSATSRSSSHRPMLRFLPDPIRSAAMAAGPHIVAPSVDTFSEDVSLHIFCGKTAGISFSSPPPASSKNGLNSNITHPHQNGGKNYAKWEVMSKAGLKHKHGIGQDVNTAFARTRCAMVPDNSNSNNTSRTVKNTPTVSSWTSQLSSDDSTPIKRKQSIASRQYYLVQEFEANLAAIRNASSSLGIEIHNDFLSGVGSGFVTTGAGALGLPSDASPVFNQALLPPASLLSIPPYALHNTSKNAYPTNAPDPAGAGDELFYFNEMQQSRYHGSEQNTKKSHEGESNLFFHNSINHPGVPSDGAHGSKSVSPSHDGTTPTASPPVGPNASSHSIIGMGGATIPGFVPLGMSLMNFSSGDTSLAVSSTTQTYPIIPPPYPILHSVTASTSGGGNSANSGTDIGNDDSEKGHTSNTKVKIAKAAAGRVISRPKQLLGNHQSIAAPSTSFRNRYHLYDRQGKIIDAKTGKVRCECGGRYKPDDGSSTAKVSWRNHAMTKQHQTWLQRQDQDSGDFLFPSKATWSTTSLGVASEANYMTSNTARTTNKTKSESKDDDIIL